jgi:hypothetical protein
VVAGAPSGAGSGTHVAAEHRQQCERQSITVITASSVPPKKLSGLEQCREIAFDELKFTPGQNDW